jgi:hypothetical protein
MRLRWVTRDFPEHIIDMPAKMVMCRLHAAKFVAVITRSSGVEAGQEGEVPIALGNSTSYTGARSRCAAELRHETNGTSLLRSSGVPLPLHVVVDVDSSAESEMAPLRLGEATPEAVSAIL